MKTATEVGGDYYDFFPSATGALTTAIGDAAGHGATAGTMVTVVKGLLTVTAADSDLPRLLGNATRAIKRMELGRMNMALTLLRIEDRRISLSAAGMPPVLHYSRAELRLREIALVGMPLGTLADVSYQHWESELAPGDTLLMMTDGFAELLNGDEETMGYPRVSELFEAAIDKEPEEIIAELAAAAETWTGGRAAARRHHLCRAARHGRLIAAAPTAVREFPVRRGRTHAQAGSVSSGSTSSTRISPITSPRHPLHDEGETASSFALTVRRSMPRRRAAAW